MTIENTAYVEAEVKYLVNDRNLAKYIASTGGGDVTEHQGNYEIRSVPIYNARKTLNRTSLDREGFVLDKSGSSVSDFYSDQQVKDIYED